ncbi:hypothetical protein CPB84DRAFT_1790025 [Gymnopilus junonius]|uniref:Uncharacterized protein n=1 Tax=Gymnopilus junonius TaxID=109634 RepID=A0A9P5TJS1_GYMJU|nr:hypothetical protein CPB84DRAFT_1790025 [Gymnopilus junonius]
MEPGEYVHELQLTPIVSKTYECPMEVWAPLLTRALRLMPNIRTVIISNYTEEIALHSPDFAFSLLSRPLLTWLELRYVGIVASDQLGQAMAYSQSMRRSAVLERVTFVNKGERMELVANKGIGSILFHSRECLTHIELHSYDLDAVLVGDGRVPLEDDQNRPIDLAPVIFPNVTSLSIPWCEASLERVSKSFPALRSLTFGSDSYPDTVNTPFHIIPFPHLTSVEGFQKQLEPSLQSISSPSLHHVSMDATWRSDGSWSVSPFLSLRVIPSLRSLKFTYCFSMPDAWWKGLDVIMPHLKYLSLRLEVNIKEDVDVLSIQLNTVPAGLAYLPLAYVSIYIIGTAEDIGDKADPYIQSRFTEGAIAYSYAKYIRTLEYIDVCKEINSKPGPVTWWSAVHKVSVNQYVEVEALEPSKGMVVRDRYNLEL